MRNMHDHFECIVVGVSAGGMEALKTILPALPANFSLPIIIVQHMRADARDWYLANHFNSLLTSTVKIANDKEAIENNHIYLAPAGYHLLVEDDRTFSLSSDAKVNYARPSIDVLFESAAFVFGPALIGIILTGANSDGAKGLKAITEAGGQAVIQDPSTAEVSAMPSAARNLCKNAKITPLPEIANYLIKVTEEKGRLI